MKWLISNKEWLFSGAGVAIIAGILSFFTGGQGDRSGSPEGVGQPTIVGNHNMPLGESSGVITIGTPNLDPNSTSALPIEFPDGSRALVEVVTVTYVTNAPILVSRVGTRKAANDLLLPIVRAKMVQYLETKSLQELRTNRPLIEQELQQSLIPVTSPYGIGVRSVTIGSVREVAPRASG